MAADDYQGALDAALARIVQALTPSAADWDRRRRLVEEHIYRLSSQLNSPHPIQISTFGSSLSGLCLANSDIDVGLFGRFNSCLLEELRPSQQQSLLRLVLKAVYKANLAKHKQVQAIWGARVPVLKYTCNLSGLECDISLQGTGALVKANIIHLLNSHSKELSALYRLVKLWAQVHDLNDASRSTFNSTSLLYMTIFYLQQLQLLPALRDLVPQDMLLQPSTRILQGSNKQLWEDPQRRRQLLAAVQAGLAAWRQRQQQMQQQLPSLGQLLQGFFQLWSGVLCDWVLGRSRDLHADLWHGTWAAGCAFAKDYIFSLQDPFDATDCPARAVGSSTNTNGGTAAFIAYMFSSSSKVMQRYHESCKQLGNNAALSPGQQQSSSTYGWFAELQQQQQQQRQRQRQQGFVAGGGALAVRMELCKVLTWLFGPQGLLLLGSYEQQQQQQHLLLRNTPVAAIPWAAAPFPQPLVAAVQQQQRQNVKAAQILTWLVQQLGAELDKDRNILCLNQLGLLTKQISIAATAAAKQVREGLHPGTAAPAAAVPATAVVAPYAVQHVAAEAGQTPTAVAADGSGPLADLQQQQHMQQPDQQLLSSRGSDVPLDGPRLPEQDQDLLNQQEQLVLQLIQLQCKLRTAPGHTPPKRRPKAVKKAVQLCIAAVIERVQHLQQVQHGQSSSARVSNAGFGLMAVLEQHGFRQILEDWGFMQDGVLWEQLLPAGFGDSNAGSADAAQQDRQGINTGVAVAEQQRGIAATRMTAPGLQQQPTAVARGAAPAAQHAAAAAGGPQKRQQHIDNTQPLLPGSNSSSSSVRHSSSQQESSVSAQAQQQQQVAAASSALSQSAERPPATAASPADACTAAAAAAPTARSSSKPPQIVLRQLLIPGRGVNTDYMKVITKLYDVLHAACQLQLAAAEAAGHDVSPLAAAAAAAAPPAKPTFSTVERVTQLGQLQLHAVVELPELLTLNRQPDGVLRLTPVAPAKTWCRLVDQPNAGKQPLSFCVKAVAKAAVKWLGSQQPVVDAVTEALQFVQHKQPRCEQQHQEKSPQQQMQNQASRQAMLAQGSDHGEPDQQWHLQLQQSQVQQENPQHQQQSSVDRHLQPNGVPDRVKIVKRPARPATAAAPTAAALAGAAGAAASHAAAAAAAALTGVHFPGAVSSSSGRPSGIAGSSQYRQEQQHSTTQGAVGNNLVSDLAKLSMEDGVGECSSNPVTPAHGGSSADSGAAHAAYRQLRQVRDQIKRLEQRIVLKQQKLEHDKQELATLQDEEQQATAAAAQQSSPTAECSRSSSNGGLQQGFNSPGAHGDLLLELAMHQSMQEMLKELRHDVNNAKSKVRSNIDALRQFEVNLQKLKQQEVEAAAALQTAEALAAVLDAI